MPCFDASTKSQSYNSIIDVGNANSELKFSIATEPSLCIQNSGQSELLKASSLSACLSDFRDIGDGVDVEPEADKHSDDVSDPYNVKWPG